MSYRINCPICGARDIYEFRFGGEDRGPKTFDENVDSETWCEYIHLKTNTAAPKKEWWYHRDGCATWFSIWRDPTINREVTVPKEKK